HRLAETHRDRVGEVARDFPEKPAFFETEDTAPNIVETYRDDRCIHVLHDALETSPERQQLADAGDLSFRENNDDLAILDRLACDTERLNHFARTLLRRNRNMPGNFRKRFDDWMLVDVFEHDAPQRPICRRLHE